MYNVFPAAPALGINRNSPKPIATIKVPILDAALAILLPPCLVWILIGLSPGMVPFFGKIDKKKK
jgi:hypothetical protein